MGARNYLIEGVSCSGKTTVCNALVLHGYHAINGDTALAYQGDPLTGHPLPGATHAHHIWDLAEVRRIIADRSEQVTFFCGGSRNVDQVIGLFDEVFVLKIDRDTLEQRLASRDGTDWGATADQRDIIRQLHKTNGDVPKVGISIDASRPIGEVVQTILEHCDLHFI